MAESLAVELAASATVVASGNGSAVDLGTRRSAVTLFVRTTGYTAIDNDPTPGVSIAVQTSASDSGPWRTVSTVSVTAVGISHVAAAGLDRYVRATWTLTNMTSVVFSVSGEAHAVYASPTDLTSLAVVANGIAELTATQIALALIAATAMAEGYVAAAFEMPITAWGYDLRKATAELAAAILFRARGVDPQGPDAVVFDAESKALKWLDRLSDGRLKPPDITDSTADDHEGGSFLVTATKRGW